MNRSHHQACILLRPIATLFSRNPMSKAQEFLFLRCFEGGFNVVIFNVIYSFHRQAAKWLPLPTGQLFFLIFLPHSHNIQKNTLSLCPSFDNDGD